MRIAPPIQSRSRRNLSALADAMRGSPSSISPPSRGRSSCSATKESSHSGPNKPNASAIDKFVDRLFVGHAARVMRDFPDNSVDLIITSPPYFTAVKYDSGESPWASYGAYRDDIQTVWNECARVLRPNGKLCVNAAAMPIPQRVFRQDTRRIENIPADIYHAIINGTDLRFYDEYVWAKQTTTAMFGSYPNPGNILANNTTERITVYVKPGKPPKFAKQMKEANKLSLAEHRDLTQQVWFMISADVKRKKGHPAPYPAKLPGRLIALYTRGAVGDFLGEIVLDPFVGSGTTCAVAKRMGRRFIGIDIEPRYVQLAQERVDAAVAGDVPILLVGKPSYPNKAELKALPEAVVRLDAERGKAKHHRKTYGRGGPDTDDLPRRSSRVTADGRVR
jgi:modification methylase